MDWREPGGPCNEHPAFPLSTGNHPASCIESPIGTQKSGYALSLSGFIGDVDHRMDVPEHLFDEELLIDNGTSALHQMNRMPAPRLRDALYLRLR